MFLVPAPLADRILLLAPLVIVPRLIPHSAAADLDRPPGRMGGSRAALPLIVAFSLTAGPVAAAFALPWLVLALIGTVSAIRHGLSQLPSILAPRRLDDLGVDVALGFWAVGAGFL